MLYTNEYTVLKSMDGGEDIELKPGKINAFSYIKGKYKPTSYARLLDTETHQEAMKLIVGNIYDGIGEQPKRTVKKARHDKL